MRQLTDEEVKTLSTWFEEKAPAWLRVYGQHNRAVLPRFYEAHPTMAVTFETLDLAITCADLLPDPYNPADKNRLKVTTSQPQVPVAPQPWSQELAARPAPESAPNKLGMWFDGREWHSTNSNLPNHAKAPERLDLLGSSDHEKRMEAHRRLDILRGFK